MVEPTKGPPPTGPELAAAMIDALGVMSQNMAANTAITKDQLALLDELNGRLEVFTRACEICADMKADGKKIGIGDFAEAVSQADEEIMGEEEEEEGEPEGDVPVPRR